MLFMELSSDHHRTVMLTNPSDRMLLTAWQGAVIRADPDQCDPRVPV